MKRLIELEPEEEVQTTMTEDLPIDGEAVEDEEENEDSEDNKDSEPVAHIGDYVRIKDYLDSDPEDFRSTFSLEMACQYCGQILQVSDYWESRDGSATMEDDGHNYVLTDLYGRKTPFVWNSSMFDVVTDIEWIKEKIRENLARYMQIKLRLYVAYAFAPKGDLNQVEKWMIAKNSGLFPTIVKADPDGFSGFIFETQDLALHFLNEFEEDFQEIMPIL